jgi:hypothetical protein
MLDLSDDNYMERSLRDFRPPTGDSRTVMHSFDDGAAFSARIIAGVKPHQLVGGEESLDELRFFEKSSKSLVNESTTKRKRTLRDQQPPVQEEDEEYEEGNSNSFQTKSQQTKRTEGFNPATQFQKAKKSKQK